MALDSVWDCVLAVRKRPGRVEPVGANATGRENAPFAVCVGTEGAKGDVATPVSACACGVSGLNP